MNDEPISVTQPYLPPLEEFIPYLERIWESKRLTNGGPFHEQLEQALCDYLGVEHLALFANGTLALVTALQAMRISGEVITTPYSFVATAHSLLWNGIKPVFVDIDPVTLNLDPSKIAAAITPQTTAILPVHCYGNPCDVEAIQTIADNYNLKVIYDAAHAFGVQIGNRSILDHGDLSVLSFHATKVFTTFEGGAIVCPDAKTKQHIDNLKNFGFVNETMVVASGINGKMNEFSAALGLCQLKHIDHALARRREVDRAYRVRLEDVSGVRCVARGDQTFDNHAYFPILVGPEYPLSRDTLYDYLREHGIHGRRYFYPLISDFPMYREGRSARRANLPVAAATADQVICLPIYPNLPDSEQSRLCDLIVAGQKKTPMNRSTQAFPTLAPCPVIFSGHNERAVVTLCRYFHAMEIPFRLIARHDADAIFKTEWRDHVLFQREEASLNLELMDRIACCLRELGLYPVLCATSEFLNRFVLDNRSAITTAGWNCALSDPGLYRSLSDKASSASIIRELIGLRSPSDQMLGHWASPCVLKPKCNVVKGKTLYPILCRSPDELASALDKIQIEEWFSQEWVDGQSLCLCAYLDTVGDFDCYWQENLLQQPGGKSIVLARNTANPGIDVNRLMAGLYDMGYFGPLMMEIMREQSGRLSYIEVNPRFWGPLNLSLKVCPSLLNRFAMDQGLRPSMPLVPQNGYEHWYAWASGAREGHCRRYPAAEAYTDADIEGLLREHDVYSAQDTYPLSGIH